MIRQVVVRIFPFILLALTACAGNESSAPPPPSVTVAQPLVRQIVDWDEYVGRFSAIQSVEVRPRATGYLSAVHFRDGQYVQKGQLLFTVDPRPAEAAFAQARAQLVQAEANYANAKTELARTQTLAEARAASQEELEARQAALRTGAAQVSAARAARRARQLDVGFTRVTAPISGRISERLVDPGNTVTADQTILTTIVSTNPLHFTFQGSEAQLLKYQREKAGAVVGTPVKIRLSDEAEFKYSGTVDFVDNAIDAGAGTIRVRASVPNSDGFLKPGMFGSLRLEASQAYPAFLVPDGAIVADASRRVVYVVGKDGTVVAKAVETGPLFGNLRVVRKGVARSDRVVIGGVQRARPGQKVSAKTGKIVYEQPQAAPVSGAAAPAAVALPVGER